MPELSVPNFTREFGVISVKADLTNHLNETITFDKDCVIRKVYFEKPADVDLTVSLKTNIDTDEPGAEVKLVESLAAATEADGKEASGDPVKKYEEISGSELEIITANGSSGDKIVTIFVSPAHVGV